MISKDRDFRDGHLIRGTPRRLLVVATGNLNNNDLLALFTEHLSAIVGALEDAQLVELHAGQLLVHGDGEV